MRPARSSGGSDHARAGPHPSPPPPTVSAVSAAPPGRRTHGRTKRSKLRAASELSVLRADWGDCGGQPEPRTSPHLVNLMYARARVTVSHKSNCYQGRQSRKCASAPPISDAVRLRQWRLHLASSWRGRLLPARLSRTRCCCTPYLYRPHHLLQLFSNAYSNAVSTFKSPKGLKSRIAPSAPYDCKAKGDAADCNVKRHQLPRMCARSGRAPPERRAQ